MNIPFVNFRPAQVMGAKEVYVSFYVLDPSCNKLKRLRVRCNRLKKRREKLHHANLVCAEINKKLYSGWNPLTGKPCPILYTTKNLFKTWQTMREKLSMPSSYHFYSLKDTGITEMLEKGVPTKYVMELAGHHSFSMTERYIHKSEAKKILSANKLMF